MGIPFAYAPNQFSAFRFGHEPSKDRPEGIMLAWPPLCRYRNYWHNRQKRRPPEVEQNIDARKARSTGMQMIATLEAGWCSIH
jgi:hypothetical protein